MATATFDIRNVITTAALDFGLPRATIAIISGISGSKISQLMKPASTLRLTGAEELAIRRAVEDVRALRNFAQPLPLDLNASEAIRDCVELFRQSRLSVAVFDPGGVTE
jgi:hypothetical protein